MEAIPRDEMGELEALVSGVNQISQSTLLLKKMKEMNEVDDALDYMKEQYKTRMEACDERQREFERRQQEMKDQVTKFEKFIQENDSKRQRADLKLKQERKVFRVKCDELSRLQSEFETASSEKQRLIEELEALKRYQWYLDRTVDAAEDNSYEETWDLLNRYRTLKNANNDLMSQVQIGESAIDKLRMELSSLSSAHTNQMLVQNSLIHEHQKHVEELRVHNKQRADEKEREEDGQKSEHRQTGQVIQAIRNLYLRCIATMRTQARPMPEATDKAQRLDYFEKCLKVVCDRIGDLEDIHAGYTEWRLRRDDGGLDSVRKGNQSNSASGSVGFMNSVDESEEGMQQLSGGDSIRRGTMRHSGAQASHY